MPATGHFAPVRLFMMSYVLLWACLSCVAAQNDATTLQTSQSDCCDVLTELHKFVRERDENDCSIAPNHARVSKPDKHVARLDD